MVCYCPIQGWRSQFLNSNCKRPIVFNPRDGYSDLPVKVPCSQCIGCRLSKSGHWAVRCMHESSLHKKNCFITLTYNNEHCPKDGSLCLDHFQRFLKRLRYYYSSTPIRFFHCGEYGDKLQRPHYHALVFGMDFDDKKFWKNSGKNKLYTSAILEKIWGKGYCVIGDVTYDSAAYVSRYILKKVSKKSDYFDSHYLGRMPEYITMSRRPGIAKQWFDKYYNDVYPSDFVTVEGKKRFPPKFYDSQYELINPVGYKYIKALRKKRALEFDYDEYELRIKQTVKCSQIRTLKRDLE